MEDKNKYKPVACELVDHIEIFATQGQIIEIEYEEDEVLHTLKTIVKTWKTEGKEEFLITQEGHAIRLDRILRLNGIRFGRSC